MFEKFMLEKKSHMFKKYIRKKFVSEFSIFKIFEIFINIFFEKISVFATYGQCGNITREISPDKIYILKFFGNCPFLMTLNLTLFLRLSNYRSKMGFADL